MKRSEMISNIESVLVRTLYQKAPIFEIANQVLNRLENEGMLPPFSEDIFMRTHHNDGTGHEWDIENGK